MEERKKNKYLCWNATLGYLPQDHFLKPNVMWVTTFEVFSHQLRALPLVLCELSFSCPFKHFVIQCGSLYDYWLWALSHKRKCHYLENCYFLLLRPLHFGNFIFNDMQQADCNQDSICPSASTQFFLSWSQISHIYFTALHPRVKLQAVIYVLVIKEGLIKRDWHYRADRVEGLQGLPCY